MRLGLLMDGFLLKKSVQSGQIFVTIIKGDFTCIALIFFNKQLESGPALKVA